MFDRAKHEELIHEYFYRRLCELDEEQRTVISALRTKAGLVILCDKLRGLETEKRVLIGIYEDLKHFF